MIRIDFTRDRLLKLWRVSGDHVTATAVVVRRKGHFVATVHYRYSDGRTRSWMWRTNRGHQLSARELVQCTYSIERGFQTIPGVRLRLDFPHDTTRESQAGILAGYGLDDVFERVGDSVLSGQPAAIAAD